MRHYPNESMFTAYCFITTFALWTIGFVAGLIFGWYTFGIVLMVIGVVLTIVGAIVFMVRGG